MPFTENNYEKALIALFENMGYQYLYGPNIERDYSLPFYEELVIDSLCTVNPKKPITAIQEAVARLKNIETGSLVRRTSCLWTIFNTASKSPIIMVKRCAMK